MHFDNETWRRLEGLRIEAKFTLDRLSSCDETRAAYETTFRDRPALIQLFPGTPEEIGTRRKWWREAAGLSHPALVEIYSRGETVIDGARCAYLVTERPDQNLADAMKGHAMTAGKAREMLGPVLGALRYLHERVFAHGGVKPENVLFFGDRTKLSSESLRPGGDRAADCLAIGVLVKEVMGGALPAPFAEIVNGSAEGWSAERLGARLQGKSPAVGAPRGRMWAIGTAGVAIACLVAFRQEPTVPPPAPAAVASEPPAKPIEKPVAASPSPAGATSPPPVVTPKPAISKVVAAPAAPIAPPPPPKPSPAAAASLDGISKVMPEIPQNARRTIRGRVRISVRVSVDGDGRVSQAAIDRPTASSYFASRVLAAARAWKFPPGQGTSDWLLHFEILRADTRVSAARVGN